MRHRQIWFRKLNEKIPDLCWTPASQEAEQLDQSDQAPQPSEEIRVCNEWNSYFSVQFVPLSQFIGAILASSGMCQVQFDLYRCWGRRLIWNNEEVSPILPYYNTIVTVVVYFCSQGYTGLLRFGDRCGHIWLTSIFGVKRYKFLTLSSDAAVSSRSRRTGEPLESPLQLPGQARTSCLEWDIEIG